MARRLGFVSNAILSQTKEVDVIQRNPPFQISAQYLSNTNMVETNLKLGVFPPIALGLSPESFFELCDGMVQVFLPFIEELKKKLEGGNREDIKLEFDDAKWNQMMKEGDHGREDQ